MKLYKKQSFLPSRTKINPCSKTVSLFSQPYLDSCNQCYKNIVTVNCLPEGPLFQIVKRVPFPPLHRPKRKMRQTFYKKIKNCYSPFQ